MHVENSPDFKTVWQLAHNWIGADLDETNSSAISPELKTAIHRLMQQCQVWKLPADGRGCESLWIIPFSHRFLIFTTPLNFINASEKTNSTKTI